MKFLKKLAFNFIKDDIEQVLKIHDQKIMEHYMKIIDDVEDIIDECTTKMTNLIQDQIDEKKRELDSEFEELKNDLYGEVRRDIQNNTPTAKEIASELDHSEITDAVGDALDYSRIAKMIIDAFAKRVKEDIE